MDDKNKRIIKSFCDYIWKEFKKAEDRQDIDRFDRIEELGYFKGRYIALKKIVESDEFEELEGLLEEE